MPAAGARRGARAARLPADPARGREPGHDRAERRPGGSAGRPGRPRRSTRCQPPSGASCTACSRPPRTRSPSGSTCGPATPPGRRRWSAEARAAAVAGLASRSATSPTSTACPNYASLDQPLRRRGTRRRQPLHPGRRRARLGRSARAARRARTRAARALARAAAARRKALHYGRRWVCTSTR